MPEVKVETPVSQEQDISHLVESFDLVVGKQKKNPDKDWTGIRIKMQDGLTFYVFPYRSQLDRIKKLLAE